MSEQDTKQAEEETPSANEGRVADEPQTNEPPKDRGQGADEPQPATTAPTEDEAVASDTSDVAEVIPEIRQIIGALLFASQAPLTVKQIRNVFKRALENYEGITKEFEGITEAQVRDGLADLKRELERAKCGLVLVEVSTGFRLQNDKACGPWIRQLLEKGRVSRLSKPALETLAIIAYRQPCTRADVEAIRGVSVDSMVRNLLEMQLLKVVGRSELPGRPWLFGTTNLFMEHFGLKNLEDLPGMTELRRQPDPQPDPEPEAKEPSSDDPETEATHDASPEPEASDEPDDGTEAEAFFDPEEEGEEEETKESDEEE